MSFDPWPEINKAKRLLGQAYSDVSQLGDGLAVFLVIKKAERSAVISVSEEGWLVELWKADHKHPGEEVVVREETAKIAEEAFQQLSDWLDAQS